MRAQLIMRILRRVLPFALLGLVVAGIAVALS
jgi:hypothetical protein